MATSFAKLDSILRELRRDMDRLFISGPLVWNKGRIADLIGCRDYQVGGIFERIEMEEGYLCYTELEDRIEFEFC